MEFRKMWDSKRDTDIKNRLLDSVGGGEGGMIERIALKHVYTICEIDDQSKFNAWNMALKDGALGEPRGMG